MPNRQLTPIEQARQAAQRRQIDINKRITAIDCLLAEGEDSTTIDGTMSHIDLDALRQERADLRKQSNQYKSRRPVISTVNLSRMMG